METYSANGKDESHCAYIEQLTYVKSSGGAGVGRPGLVVFLIILGVALLGVGGYLFYQKKSESLCVCLCCCMVAMYLTDCLAFATAEKTVKGSVDSDGLMAHK
jgi:LPXTG-motif cell wall-anchored protein